MSSTSKRLARRTWAATGVVNTAICGWFASVGFWWPIALVAVVTAAALYFDWEVIA